MYYSKTYYTIVRPNLYRQTYFVYTIGRPIILSEDLLGNIARDRSPKYCCDDRNWTFVRFRYNVLPIKLRSSCWQIRPKFCIHPSAQNFHFSWKMHKIPNKFTQPHNLRYPQTGIYENLRHSCQYLRHS